MTRFKRPILVIFAFVLMTNINFRPHAGEDLLRIYIENIGSEGVPLLIELLGGDDKNAVYAAETLGKIGDERAIVPLAQWARSSKRQVIKIACLMALMKIGASDIKSLDYLGQLLLWDRDPFSRNVAANLYLYLETSDRMCETLLFALAYESSYQVRHSLLRTLGSLEMAKLSPEYQVRVRRFLFEAAATSAMRYNKDAALSSLYRIDRR